MNKELQPALDAAQTMLQMLNKQDSDDMLINSLQGYAASIVNHLQKLQQTHCSTQLPLDDIGSLADLYADFHWGLKNDYNAAAWTDERDNFIGAMQYILRQRQLL